MKQKCFKATCKTKCKQYKRILAEQGTASLEIQNTDNEGVAETQNDIEKKRWY